MYRQKSVLWKADAKHVIIYKCTGKTRECMHVSGMQKELMTSRSDKLIYLYTDYKHNDIRNTSLAVHKRTYTHLHFHTRDCISIILRDELDSRMILNPDSCRC